MTVTRRFRGNPILSPDPSHAWEARGSFNGCPIAGDDGYHLLYRAQSTPQSIGNSTLELSTIGHAVSFDRVTFLNRRKLITPEHAWEQFGCEDPRVTNIDDTYFIFYTAIASWPPEPTGISVGLATTKDFFRIEHKYHITPFNAKAMTLFPKKINGTYTALLTVHPDIPPSTIAIAQAQSLDDFTRPSFWKTWYAKYKDFAVPLLRNDHDHVEIGAPPIETPEGWLLIYSYIKSYRTSHKFFGIEAVLLDPTSPKRILLRTHEPLLYPEYDYELEGNIPNVIFPSGAVIHNNTLGIYYGAADTTTCLATCQLDELLGAMRQDTNIG